MSIPAITEEGLRDFHRKHFPNAHMPMSFPSFHASFSTPAAMTAPANTAFAAGRCDAYYNAGYNAGYYSGYSAGCAAGHPSSVNIGANTTADATTDASASTGTKRKHDEVEDEAEYGADGEGYYQEYYEDEGDGDLGYYPDGTERTLSDEDVAFYRRSELREMLKQAKLRVAERREREAEERAAQEELEAEGLEAMDLEAQELEAQELEIQELQAQQEQPEEGEQNGEQMPDVLHEQDAPAGPESTNEPGSVETNASDSKAAKNKVAKFEIAESSVEKADQASEHSVNSPATSSTLTEGDKCKRPGHPLGKNSITSTKANKGKKRKRILSDDDPRPVEDEGVTYRRIARELDDMPSVSVELDY